MVTCNECNEPPYQVGKNVQSYTGYGLPDQLLRYGVRCALDGIMWCDHEKVFL